MKTKQIILLILIVLVASITGFAIYRRVKLKWNYVPEPKKPTIVSDELFDYDMIHMANKENKNYLISPYSIAYALTILNEGASGETKKQIESVLKKYDLQKTANIKDRISIANALFIKNEYTKDINKNYIENSKKKFDAEVLFDDFNTPKVINDWAKEHTYNMIDKVLDQIDKDFVLGIANAIAIDVEWNIQFMEESTRKEDFTKVDGTVKQVDMMHTSDDVTYISNDKAKGIIKDYKKYENTELEFIAIMPEGNIQDYVNTFNKTELDSLLENKKTSDSKTTVNLSLPKFKFDYTYDNFKDDLIALGVKDAFDEYKADFSEMVNDESDLELYVGQAVHKTHIDLSEYGTKAAAVTFFGMFKATAMPQEKEVINIKFDKPFLFLIKEKNSDNVWFFGTVYEP